MSISEYNPFTNEYILTEDYKNKRIELMNSFLALSGLIPGRCLRVDIKAYETNGVTISSTVKYFNPLLRVTCGCPSPFLDELANTEPSGAPGNFSVQQVCGF